MGERSTGLEEVEMYALGYFTMAYYSCGLATVVFSIASFTLPVHAQQIEQVKGLAFHHDENGVIAGFQYSGDGMNLSDWLLVNLTGLENITCVSLQQHKVLTHELEAIADLGSVESLVVGSYPDVVPIDRTAIEALAKLSLLSELSIATESSTVASWEEIGSLRSLRSLELGIGIKLSQQDLDGIGNLASLEHLRVDGIVNCQSFDWLSKLRKLRSLHIRSPVLKEGVLLAVEKLHLLNEVQLGGVVLEGSQVERHLYGLSGTLQSIDIELKGMSAVESLKAFENLRHVSVKLPQASEFHLSVAAQFPRLETLCVTGAGGYHGRREQISELVNLKSVIVYDDNYKVVFEFLREKL